MDTFSDLTSAATAHSNIAAASSTVSTMRKSALVDVSPFRS